MSQDDDSTNEKVDHVDLITHVLRDDEEVPEGDIVVNYTGPGRYRVIDGEYRRVEDD